MTILVSDYTYICKRLEPAEKALTSAVKATNTEK